MDMNKVMINGMFIIMDITYSQSNIYIITHSHN